MNIVLDKKDATTASLKVTITPEDYKPKTAKKIKEYTQKAQVKGFRMGKVPPALIHKLYGKEVLMQEVNTILQDGVNEYIKENPMPFLVGEILPAVQENVGDFDNPKDFEFIFDLGMASEFKLELDKISLTKKNIVVTDEIITETVKNLCKQFATNSDVEVISENGMVYGTLTQKEGDFTLENSAIPIDELTEEGKKLFLGKKLEEITFGMEGFLLKPESARHILGVYQNDEQLETLSKGTFTIAINKIMESVPAEVNKELFDKTFPTETIETEEEFRQKVKGILSENYNSETQYLLNAEIKEVILENTHFDLPADFLKRWLFDMNEGKFSRETIDKEYPNFEKGYRWTVIEKKLVQDYNITVTAPEIQQEAMYSLMDQFRKYGMTDMSAFGDMKDIVANYLKAEDGKNLRETQQMVINKKLDVVLAKNIKIQETDITMEQFGEIVKAHAEKQKIEK